MPKKQKVLLVINILMLVAMLVMTVLFCTAFVDFLIDFTTPNEEGTVDLIGMAILVFIYLGIIALPFSALSLIFSLINRKFDKKRGNVLLILTLAMFAIMLAIFLVVWILLAN